MTTYPSTIPRFVRPPQSEVDLTFAVSAVEHWERPSQMLDEIAWFVAYTVGWSVEGEGLAEAARRYALAESRGVDFFSRREWADWIRRIADRDRLRAWKIALYGWLEAERVLLLVDPNRSALRVAYRLFSTLDLQWTALDDMPAAVAARFAFALAGHAELIHAVDAIVRQRPDLLYSMASVSRRDGPIPDWLIDLADEDPIRALKIGLEALLRNGDRSAFQLLRSPRHDRSS